MDKKQLTQLLIAAVRPTAGVNFADVNSAAKNALLEHFGFDANTSIREMQKQRANVFAIIEEVVDELLPQELNSLVGQFAEVKTYGRDDEVKFTLKGLGKDRVMRSIVKGARGGIYRAHRLDDKDFMVPTSVYTVGYNITLEELLSGRRTIGELIDIVTKGYVEIIYVEVIKALRAAASFAPDNNKDLSNAYSEVALKKVIRTVSAYGNPVIFAFQSAAEQITNVAGLVSAINPNIAAADLDEIRAQGRVSIYHGTPIVVLPNYFMDSTNSTWLFKENQVFILPTDAKPVKVAIKGESYSAEIQQPHGGMEWSVHNLMGVAILFYNNIGILQISATDPDGVN